MAAVGAPPAGGGAAVDRREREVERLREKVRVLDGEGRAHVSAGARGGRAGAAKDPGGGKRAAAKGGKGAKKSPGAKRPGGPAARGGKAAKKSPGTKPGAKKPGAKKEPGAKKPGAKKEPGAKKPGAKKEPGAKKPGAKKEPGAKRAPGAKKPGAKKEPGAKKPGAKKEPGAKPGAKKPGTKRGAGAKAGAKRGRPRRRRADAEPEEEIDPTDEERMGEGITDEEIANFQVGKANMEQLINRVCEMLSSGPSGGTLQGDVWRRLKLTLSDGFRLALKLEWLGLITREKVLENGRWTYRLILKRTPISTRSIVGAPCLTCNVEQKCTPDGEISPHTCDLIRDWVLFEAKRPRARA